MVGNPGYRSLGLSAAANSGGHLITGVIRRAGFGVLVFLVSARGQQRPREAQPSDDRTAFSPAYWRYLVVVALGVAGFAHLVLIAYRLEVNQLVPAASIPLLFALAMGVDAVVAYVTGHLYDRIGLRTLYALPVLMLPSAPLLFLGTSVWTFVVGMVFWGAAMGLQESLLRAAVAGLAPAQRRGTAYGPFDTAYGAAWMVGSIVMGWLFGLSPTALVAFALAAQVPSLVPLVGLARRAVG